MGGMKKPKLTPAQRSKNASKAAGALWSRFSPEQRTELMRNLAKSFWANLSKDERKRIIAARGMSKKGGAALWSKLGFNERFIQTSKAGKAFWFPLNSVQRSELMSKRSNLVWLLRSSEQRRKLVGKTQAKITSEIRAEAVRKANETRGLPPQFKAAVKSVRRDFCRQRFTIAKAMEDYTQLEGTLLAVQFAGKEPSLQLVEKINAIAMKINRGERVLKQLQLKEADLLEKAKSAGSSQNK